MSDIFISYASEDRERPQVQRLAEVLESLGWVVWWDRKLVAGPRFRRVIARELASARCVVVVWSKHALESDWVIDEADDARKQDKLVAVLIDDIEPPMGFRGIQAADLVTWDGNAGHKEFCKVRDGIGLLLGRTQPAVPPPIRRWRKLTAAARMPSIPGWIVKVVGWSAASVLSVLIVYYAITLIDWQEDEPERPLKVAVMEFKAARASDEDASVSDVTRTRVESLLCNVGAPDLDVTSMDMVHFRCRDLEVDGRLSHDQLIPCAERLSIHKMIVGDMSLGASDIVLDVRVVDVHRRMGKLDHQFPRKEKRGKLDKLQTDAAEDLLKWFRVELTPARTLLLEKSRAQGTSQHVNNMMDGFPVAEEETTPPTPTPPSSARLGLFPWSGAIAEAQEDLDKAAIRELLRQYQEALQAKSTDQCAALQVEMTESQREKLQRYFDGAGKLTVEIKISDTDIAVSGNEAVATFTRTDQFKEVPTGRDVQLDVRLSSLLAKQDGHWKIRGLRKPL